jgi:hypothetical protein
MSADRIERCPECGDGALREWFNVELVKQDTGVPYIIRVDYRCECRDCMFNAVTANVEGSLNAQNCARNIPRQSRG